VCNFETGFYKRCKAIQWIVDAFPDMRVSNNANQNIERAIAWSQSALLKSHVLE